MNSSLCLISDSDWDIIQKVLPKELEKGKGTSGGRPNPDFRKIFCGILYLIRTGCQWRLLPKEYGSKSTVSKYLNKWTMHDVFHKLMTECLEIYDQTLGIQWKFQSIDGSMKRAPGCSENAGRNPTDRGKPGSKHVILTDQSGIPLSIIVKPANISDMNQIEPTFEQIKILKPDPEKVLQHLCADKGFDSEKNRQILIENGYKEHICRKKSPSWIPIKKYTSKRWVVERTHSWINQFRGIHIRRFRRGDFYLNMSILSCICIILSKL